MSAHVSSQLLERLAQVPKEPGCYLWKGKDGEVLYVGKAKNLRARMRQYVLGQDERAKIPLMMREVADYEYVVATSEYESLVLEKNLIQHYRPRYNVDYRDDKSYPFIAITHQDLFPAIKYTREKRKSNTKYFGPYTDARAARDLIDIVRRIAPICSASCSEHKRLCRAHPKDKSEHFCPEILHNERACFDAQVGKGPGACTGAIDPQTYAVNVARIEQFLSGKRSVMRNEITQRMHAAAADLDFERAARERDKLATIDRLDTRQQVVLAPHTNLDAIGIYREETITGVHLFVVREGRVIISNEFILNAGMDVDESDIISTFMKRYYDQSASVGREVLVSALPDDVDLLNHWLSQLSGHRVQIKVARRGEKKDLFSLATQNAKHALMRFKVKTRYDDDRTNTAFLELESALALPCAPMRIECFDISTIHGSYNVASMVVFTNGKPDKQQYRRFKIRMQTDEAHDFAMMQEVLKRRYAPERMADKRFGSMPDLVIVDGGKPQLNAAQQIFNELGITVALAGLAKADEELFVPWNEEGPIVLPSGSASLYLVKAVRDEAHRFAITFHRELRAKGMTKSLLDEVSGVGPQRKRALLKHFGSMKRLMSASEEEIAAVAGMNAQVAQEVRRVLNQYAQMRHEVHSRYTSDSEQDDFEE